MWEETGEEQLVKNVLFLGPLIFLFSTLSLSDGLIFELTQYSLLAFPYKSFATIGELVIISMPQLYYLWSEDSNSKYLLDFLY